MRRWIVYHGTPKQIHTDQGTEFESVLFKQLSKLLGSTKTRTSPYRPQSDGQVERFNRSLLNMLSAFVTEHGNDWDEHLPYVCMAYRCSQHSSTGCTPFAMVHGRECTMPIDLLFPDVPNVESLPPSCGPQYVQFIRRALQTAHQFARSHLQAATARQKKGYDAYARDRPHFNVNDFVRYYYPPSKVCNKFARPWIGPFKVVDRPTMVDYKIQLVSDPSKVRVVHIDTIKPYETPYSSSELAISQKSQYEPAPDVFEDHPDHLDLPVTDENPEIIEEPHPPMLDSEAARSIAHDRVRRTIKSPDRFGYPKSQQSGNPTQKLKPDSTPEPQAETQLKRPVTRSVSKNLT